MTVTHTHTLGAVMALLAPALGLQDQMPTVPKASRTTKKQLSPDRKPRYNDWRPDVTDAPAKDGIKAVHVSLFGKNAKGVRMTLDAEDWERIKALYGDRYFVKCVGRGEYFYVSAHGRKAREASGQRSGHGGSLARLIVGATAGQVVRYKDGNGFNLRRSNLGLLTGKRAVDFKLEHAE